jgi:hypothetical protein
MSIIRGQRPESGYYRVSNTVSGDKNLSWAARGLLIFLLSKPDHWEVSVAALVNETAGSLRGAGGHTKRDGVKAIIAELTDAGYIARSDKPKHNPDGSFAGYDYIVSDSPQPSPDKPSTVEPSPVEPSTPNPTQVKTDSKEQLTKAVKTEKVAARPSLPEWLDPELWAEWEQHRREKKKPMTPSSALKTIEQLATYRAQGVDLKAAINHSIANGYQGIFPPNSKTSGVSSNKTKSLADMDYSTPLF